MPDPIKRDVLPDRCISALVPQAAIDAAVLAASKPAHDDGHTDCFYAGVLLAAWPHLNAQVDRLRAEVEALRALYTEENEERAKAQAQVERLRSAFADLLEEAKDMRAYVPDYFAEKWKHDEALERAKTALQTDEQEATG